MKKMTLLTMAFAALFSITSCSKKQTELENTPRTPGSKMNVNKTQSTATHSEVPSDFQQQANEYLQRINAAFSTKAQTLKNDYSNYPGYYGGGFINENGKLVVFVKGDVSKGRMQLVNIIGSDDFLTLPGKHSYKELMKVIQHLNDFKNNKANESKSKNFNSYGLMGRKNEITVELDEFNESKIQEFRKTVLNSDAIVFRKSSGKFQLEGILQPGCKLSLNSTGTNYGSFAFRAKRNSDNVAGMVTAGHVIPFGGSVWSDGVYVGTCTQSNQGGSVDAAFIRAENTSITTPSNTLCGTSDILSTTTSRPGRGTVVNMRGAYTGTSSGTIDCENCTLTDNGVVYTSLTSATYASDHGDSGGIVYSYVSTTGTRYGVGVHMGSTTAGFAYFCKADLVLSTLGLYRY